MADAALIAQWRLITRLRSCASRACASRAARGVRASAAHVSRSRIVPAWHENEMAKMKEK
jgi:hypothetical protein